MRRAVHTPRATARVGRARQVGPRSSRSGVTLVELLVVLILLGLMAGIAGIAVSRTPERAIASSVTARVAQARRAALRDGGAVTLTLRIDGRPYDVTAFPNGSVVADSSLNVDRLTGEWVP